MLKPSDKQVKTSLKEDLQRLGIADMYQDVIAEDESSDNSDDDAPEGDAVDDDSADVDGIDGEYVSEALLERIKGLDFGALEEGDIDELIAGMSTKKFADDATDELKESAEEAVKMVVEAKAKKVRRSAALSMKKKKSYQCPEGFRQVSQGGGSPRCVPSHRAAGGMGALKKEARKKAKWARGGKGAISQKKSARWADRRESVDESMSPLALELRELVEGVEEKQPVVMTERDRVVERLVNIVALLSEEFDDKGVTEFYNEKVESLLDSYELGRLDEDTVDQDEFIAEISPVLNMVRESLRKLDGGESLGN